MTDPATAKPGNCVYPGAEEPYPPAEGGYSATRNPFVYFHSLLDLGDCATNDLPLTSLEAALRKADATPNLSYISPSLCNSGLDRRMPGRPGWAARRPRTPSSPTGCRRSSPRPPTRRTGC